jgi:hypothetical protein
MVGPVGVGTVEEELAVTVVAMAAVSELDKEVLTDEDEDDSAVELYAYNWSSVSSSTKLGSISRACKRAVCLIGSLYTSGPECVATVTFSPVLDTKHRES